MATKRSQEIDYNTNNTINFRVAYSITSRGLDEIEALFFKKLVNYRENKRKNSFKISIDKAIEILTNFNVGPSNKVIEKILNKYGEPLLKSGTTLKEILRRPKVTFEDIKELDEGLLGFDRDTKYQIEVQVKYEGYIQKQLKMIEKHKQLENKRIPTDFEYSGLRGLTNEAIVKLGATKPANIGQASRISGITPADISVLIMYLEGRIKK